MSRSILPLCAAAAILLLPSFAKAQILTSAFEQVVVIKDAYGNMVVEDNYDPISADGLMGLPFDLILLFKLQDMLASYPPPTFLVGLCRNDPSDCRLDRPVDDLSKRKPNIDGRVDDLGSSDDSFGGNREGEVYETPVPPFYYVGGSGGLRTLDIFLRLSFPRVSNLFLPPSAAAAPSPAAPAASLAPAPSPVTMTDTPPYPQDNLFYNVVADAKIPGIAAFGESPVLSVPESSTWAMATIGVAGLGAVRMRKRSKTAAPT
jgi:hypothetical protein